MKKLFTLLALLACFMGANAKTVVDVEVDYSTYDKDTWNGGWRSGSAETRTSIIPNVGIYFHSEEAVDPFYDVQFQLPGVSGVDSDASYTVTLKIKGEDGKFIRGYFSGSSTPGNIDLTSEEQTFTFTDCVNNPNDQYWANTGSILIQCGDYVGDFWITYIKITHEESDDDVPVQWANILINGDASAPWANPNAQSVNNAYDGEGAELVSAYSKEFGVNNNNPHAALIEDGVFVCHSQIVDPVLVWDSDGEQWGQAHSAGDPMPDNTWQNQFWINFPRPMKDGEQFQITFRYKASEAARVTTQDHKAPGEYLGGGNVGELNFTTEWQTYGPKTISAAAGVQSIAFNLGEDQQYLKEIDYFIDDINISTMVLEEGLFVASTNIDSGLVPYDYKHAVEFTYDEAEDAYVATVGTVGNSESWVNQLMIATARGNDKGFKSSTIKLKDKFAVDEWLSYVESGNSKIDLPAAGVWTIMIAPDDGLIQFHQVEGDAIVVQEPVDIVANPTEIVIEGVERDDLADGDDGSIREEEGGEGQTWDNQFFIVANRIIEGGTETVLEFDYFATVEANTLTGTHAQPGEYRKNAFEDVLFTTTEQHFSTNYTIPAADWGNNPITDAQTISFDMAVIKGANTYTIKNVKWYLKGEENAEGKTMENLINATGTDNFKVKIGAGNAVVPYGTGIQGVLVDKNTSTVTYNLAGQRVSNDYKGIVVKSGKKVVLK